MASGSKKSSAFMTPEESLRELYACGTSTAVGLSCVVGSARSIRTRFIRVEALARVGFPAHCDRVCGGRDTVAITDSVRGDLILRVTVM